MRTTVIAICVQTHAQSQGFHCDDHVDKTCRVVYFNDPEIEAKVTKRIAEFTELSNKSLDARTEVWIKKNPEETECNAEGEEFVGHIWIETTNTVDQENFTPDSSDKSGAEFLEILNVGINVLWGYCWGAGR